jgi:DNA-binding MarR family transcriptional regulator
MGNDKILVKFSDKNEIMVDLTELLIEKYGSSPDTIENVEGVKTFAQIQKRHFKKGEFYMESFAFDRLILDKEYNMVDLRLIIALKSRLDFNNRIKTFRQSEIAEELKSSQANISRAINKLVNDEVIFKDGHDYYFSDKYIKGSGDKVKK